MPDHFAVAKLANRLSCHALSPEGLLAIPDNGKVILYERAPDGSGWKQVDVLAGHDDAQVISGLDWGTSPAGSRLVSSSHDRNSYVWTQKLSSEKGTPTWSPELVITRLTRAGLCVRWSSNGLKFAIGSGEPSICVCIYDAERELWAPRLIRKGHTSSIMAVAWHPSDALVATVSTDSTCRVAHAYIQGVDTSALPPSLANLRFGDCVLEVAAPNNGWGLAVAWSPSGTSLAFSSQKGLTIISGFDLDNTAPGAFQIDNNNNTGDGNGALHQQNIILPSLPLKCLTFLTDDVLVGGGFDYKPLVIKRNQQGSWTVDAFIESASRSKGGASNKSGLSNTIVSISSSNANGGRLRCMTASLDGCIAEWDVGE